MIVNIFAATRIILITKCNRYVDNNRIVNINATPIMTNSFDNDKPIFVFSLSGGYRPKHISNVISTLNDSEECHDDCIDHELIRFNISNDVLSPILSGDEAVLIWQHRTCEIYKMGDSVRFGTKKYDNYLCYAPAYDSGIIREHFTGGQPRTCFEARPPTIYVSGSTLKG